MKFVANDGRIFDSVEKCEEHEKFLEALAERENKKKEEQNARWREVVEAKRKYDDLKEKYFDDYKSIASISYDDLEDFVNELFGV